MAFVKSMEIRNPDPAVVETNTGRERTERGNNYISETVVDMSRCTYGGAACGMSVDHISCKGCVIWSVLYR
jgi:hypothetical protein